MRYVTHAEGTVKGLVKVDLGERTLIVGPNWSHKSAIVNTVELALTGAASDVMGRAVVKDAAMLESLGNEIGVTAMVRLSDGAEVEWRKEVGKKATGPTAVKGSLPKVSFPLREVREALAGNANTVRQFFLRLAAGAVTWEEVLARVPTPLHERMNVSALGGGEPVDRLLRALEAAGERLREARAAAKAQNTVAQNAGSGLGPPPSEAELGQARGALDAKKDEIQRLERAFEIAGLVQKGQELHQELNGLSGPTPADEVRPAQIRIVKFAADHDLRTCPACGIPLPQPFQWTARLGGIEEKFIAREKVLEGYRSVQSKLEEVKAELRRHRYDAQAPLDHPDGVLIEAIIAGNGDGLTDLDEARGDLAAAQQIYDEMQRTAGAWEQIRRARDMAAEADQDVAAWEQLLTALKRAVTELLDRSVTTFTTRVQDHLPETWRFGLQLRDGEKEVCRYGLEEAPLNRPVRVLRTALSGGQWATVTVAIACVVMEQTVGEDGIAIIVPEDRAWDSGALSEVLTALADAPCQVIVATTTMPEPPPAGWLILQTDHEGRIVQRTETVALRRAPAEVQVSSIPAGTPAPPAPPAGAQAPKRRPGRPPKSAATAKAALAPVVRATPAPEPVAAVPPELE